MEHIEQIWDHSGGEQLEGFLPKHKARRASHWSIIFIDLRNPPGRIAAQLAKQSDRYSPERL